MVISQLMQATLAKAGIKIDLDLKQGGEFIDAHARRQVRCDVRWRRQHSEIPEPRLPPTASIAPPTTRSWVRLTRSPAYVAAIERVNTTFGSGEAVKAAYDNLNKVLVESCVRHSDQHLRHRPDRGGRRTSTVSPARSTTCSWRERSGSNRDDGGESLATSDEASREPILSVRGLQVTFGGAGRPVEACAVSTSMSIRTKCSASSASRVRARASRRSR